MHNPNKHTQKLAESSQWFPNLWNVGYYGRKRATITVRLARLTREKHVVLPGALATVITVSNGEEGKLHKQNIFYDILLIIVIREYILGINCFHATIFIWKFFKNELDACLQMVEGTALYSFFWKF